MSVFRSSQSFPVAPPDLTPVAQDVMRHFEQKGYEVHGEQTLSQGWDLSIYKGGVFKTILGMKTALKISIEPAGTMTTARAGIGIFGLQAVPTAISLLLFWPVLIPQLWGLVQQSKLDEEAVHTVHMSLLTHLHAGGSATPLAAGTASGFCTNCGVKLPFNAKFCPECGSKTA